ncbi:MAG: hypothetical protein IBX55_23525 [Methyloprofundus sp.]|nr:hypothetical protein [Methyloprofundus sp.]
MDSRFLFLWVACHTAFSQEASLASLSDGQKFNQFLKRLVSIYIYNKVHQELLQQFSQAIHRQYLLKVYWNYRSYIVGFDDWETRSRRIKKVVKLSIINQETLPVLIIVFSRPSPLRKEAMHVGTACFSQVNRQKLKHASQLHKLQV